VFVVAGPVLADRIGVAVWLGVTHEPCGPVWVLFPAHAMSPIGGVGINLAVADAVAAANILCAPLRKGRYQLTDR
jgi:hypothetical protein